MDRLFLDANVLFSAAYRPNAGVQRLWKLTDAALFTSCYAAEEARLNLAEPPQRERLHRLLHKVEVLPVHPDLPLPPSIKLPEKDRPILQAAIYIRATHLLTGDLSHFGRHFGKTVSGVLILAPGDYLRLKSAKTRAGD